MAPVFGFRRKASDATPSDAPDRLATLSRRIDDVESTLRKLHGEWLDTYERLNRLVGRMVKRAERDALAAEPDDTPPAAAGRPPPANGIGALADVAKRRNRQSPFR